MERKNLPLMMQEREKDWSRRPVFAQAKNRQNIDRVTQKIETNKNNSMCVLVKEENF